MDSREHYFQIMGLLPLLSFNDLMSVLQFSNRLVSSKLEQNPVVTLNIWKTKSKSRTFDFIIHKCGNILYGKLNVKDDVMLMIFNGTIDVKSFKPQSKNDTARKALKRMLSNQANEFLNIKI